MHELSIEHDSIGVTWEVVLCSMGLIERVDFRKERLDAREALFLRKGGWGIGLGGVRCSYEE
jgi:hypothetical protein